MEQWELEQKRDEFIKDFYYEKLNFCGCGSPSDTLYVIRNVLNVIKLREDRWDSEDYYIRQHEYYELHKKEIKESLNLKEEKVIGDKFYLNEGVVQIVLNVLDCCGVLEHGGSIGGSWLTNYGKELLEYLNALSNEDLQFALS